MEIGRIVLSCALAGALGVPGAAMGQEDGEAGAGGDQPGEAPAAEELAEPIGFWSGWDGSVETGLNGSTGNTERFNLRAAVTGERLTERMDTRAGMSYILGTEDGTTTESNFDANARNDWLVPASPWRYFAKGRAEFDDFQEWDWRLSGFGGVGYEFIDTEKTLLLGRVGAGLSKRIGGDENRIRPEGLLGADLEHQLSERSKIFASGEYLPDLGEFPQYRATASAGYEVLVDPELGMSFKTGAELEYDSNPGEGFKRADVNYFAVLVWSF